MTAGTPERTPLFKRLGPLGPLAIVAAALPAIGAFVLLVNLSAAGDWLRSHPGQGMLIYIVGFAVTSGFAILPTFAQAVLGGWVFGLVHGSSAALVGILGGALIGYAVARPTAGQRVTDLIAEHPKWQAVYDALLGSGTWRRLGIVTLLRLPPNSPFAMTNLVLAATHVPIGTYIVATAVGILPRTVAAVYIGGGLESLADGTPKQAWLTVAGIASAVVVVAIIGFIAHRAIERVTEHFNGPGAAESTEGA